MMWVLWNVASCSINALRFSAHGILNQRVIVSEDENVFVLDGLCLFES